MGMILLVFIAIACMILYVVHGKQSHLQLEPVFSEAGVRVSYCNGTITIKDQIYDVMQVRGVKMNPSERHHIYGHSHTKNVVIEIDEHCPERPRYKISLGSSERAQRFVQRLSMALKRAGRPKKL